MRFSELDGRRIALWGLGRETRSFAAHAAQRLPRARIAVIVDDDTAAVTAEALDGLTAEVVGPDDVAGRLEAGDVLVRSPGVSRYRPQLLALQDAGVTVTTATALWLAEREGRRVIGVTGTKGKSTTATLVAHLMTAAGARVELAGNIGRPALDLLDAPATDWAVVELSSYQIADLRCGPEVAVFTNLFDEHVDWHGSAAAYRRDKLRLLGLPGVRACVVPAGDDEIAAAVPDGTPVRRFGAQAGWHVTADGGIAHAGRGIALAGATLPLRGRHNAANLCAALTALEAAGIDVPRLPDALDGARALPHRLQTVCEANGVEWVDDSISTTPESTLAALDAFAGRRIVLIAGGHDREQDYAELARAAHARDVVILGLPITGARLVAAARAAGIDADRAREVPDLPAAVAAAHALAAPGTAVLLSPAAPSYNTYKNFEERGDHFAALARAAAGDAEAGP